MTDEEPSYIDYEVFLDPSFSSVSFANKLVLATHDRSDTTLDLSTPLSKVLFDVQEIDTHIDSLTTKSALPLLEYTSSRAQASQRILDEVEAQAAGLTAAYKALQKEVIERYEAAAQVRLVAERLGQTARLARSVGRCLLLGRQLQVQMGEYKGSRDVKTSDAMVRSANTLASLKTLLATLKPGQEGHGLDRVSVISTLKNELLIPVEKDLLSDSQDIIRRFSIRSKAPGTAPGSVPTFAQIDDAKTRTTSALLVLYLLSSVQANTKPSNFEPDLMISALQGFLQSALRTSLDALARSLATLPTLDGKLVELSSRCQDIIALETILESVKPIAHPALEVLANTDKGEEITLPDSLLQPLLQSLDTASLPSFFWRSLASALPPVVQDILNRGGTSARTLRNNKTRVRDSIRQCVSRASQIPDAFGRSKSLEPKSWEREATVMVAAVIGPLNR